MKFLVDNQLPAALCLFFQNHGHQAVHVLNLSMDEADDTSIWNLAKEEGYVVVSKDEDFMHLANRPQDDGLLLWVRIGNCRRSHLLDRLAANLDGIIAAFASGSRVVELR